MSDGKSLYMVCWAVKGECWTCSPPLCRADAIREFESHPIDDQNLASLFIGNRSAER